MTTRIDEKQRNYELLCPQCGESCVAKNDECFLCRYQGPVMKRIVVSEMVSAHTESKHRRCKRLHHKIHDDGFLWYCYVCDVRTDHSFAVHSMELLAEVKLKAQLQDIA